jgi:hypothetical protein
MFFHYKEEFMLRIAFLLVPLCLSISQAAAAAEITVLGPTPITRTRGAPNVHESTFTAFPGPAKLIVKNGLANGRNRASSAVVRVNGQAVLRQRDINPQVYEIVIPLDLSETNTIAVKLNSKPGSFLTIEIIQESVAQYAWLLEFEGTLSAPSTDFFGLDGASFRLTMLLDFEKNRSAHDIGVFLLSGYKTSEICLEIDGHGESTNNTAALLIWDSQIASLNDRLSIHADITDSDEAIPFDFGADMMFSPPGLYLPADHFGDSDPQPVSNAHVLGVWPATAWRLLPTGEVESYILGVKDILVSLDLIKQ